MRILTRYLLRAHIGPFLFALTVLTGILVLPRSQIGSRDAVGVSTTPSGAVASATASILVVTPTVDGTPDFVFRK